MFVLKLYGIQRLLHTVDTFCTFHTTFNSCFSTAKYLFKILYLPMQVHMVYVYVKTGFKRDFKEFNVHMYFSKNIS